ncbi:MAG: serine/threonine protein kinase, partial [Myxococcales bacterium]|nr:serine/threonine protein kinase [Myxococcales bacterium]
MAKENPSTFGKYTLLRKIASGGMGEIFLAKQAGPSGFEKLLVIKRILSHHLEKADYLDMFLSEAKLVARLSHQNIIQIHEMGEIDGDYYIAMEFVRGKSLRDVIDELRAEGRMLPLPHVIELGIKLCEGLGYAHQARDIRGRPMNIVHRDINPHNVLIS